MSILTAVDLDKRDSLEVGLMAMGAIKELREADINSPGAPLCTSDPWDYYLTILDCCIRDNESEYDPPVNKSSFFLPAPKSVQKELSDAAKNLLDAVNVNIHEDTLVILFELNTETPDIISAAQFAVAYKTLSERVVQHDG